MKAYAIVMKDHALSEGGYKTLVESSENVGNDFTIERFDAIVADNVDEHMEKEGLEVDLARQWPCIQRGTQDEVSLLWRTTKASLCLCYEPLLSMEEVCRRE